MRATTKRRKDDVLRARRLEKAILIDATPDGVISYRPKGALPPEHTLPIFSVDTEADAERLVVLLCKRTYDGQYLLTPRVRRPDRNKSTRAFAFAEAFVRAYRQLERRRAP